MDGTDPQPPVDADARTPGPSAQLSAIGSRRDRGDRVASTA